MPQTDYNRVASPPTFPFRARRARGASDGGPLPRTHRFDSPPFLAHDSGAHMERRGQTLGNRRVSSLLQSSHAKFGAAVTYVQYLPPSSEAFRAFLHGWGPCGADCVAQGARDDIRTWAAVRLRPSGCRGAYFGIKWTGTAADDSESELDGSDHSTGPDRLTNRRRWSLQALDLDQFKRSLLPAACTGTRHRPPPPWMGRNSQQGPFSFIYR
jgi:hypothetical protein